jgi:hypothetical protein
MADIEVSISKTLSVRGKEWHDWSLYKPYTHIHDWSLYKSSNRKCFTYNIIWYFCIRLVKWSVRYMGVRLVRGKEWHDWSLYKPYTHIHDWSLYKSSTHIHDWSLYKSLPFLTSNRKCFTYWHFNICHSLPLTESVLLIDTSKSAIPYL